MRLTRLLVCLFSFFFFLPALSSAATDKDCLNHLGGAFAGVECYNGLSNDVMAENKILIDKISATIPAGNRNKKLLQQYLRAQADTKKYCQLSKEALTAWVSEVRPVNPRYYFDDVAYYKCIYDHALQQNRFLNELLDNAPKTP